MDLNGPTPKSALTPRQATALPYIASTDSLNQGAIRAQIGLTTLKRWMNDVRFRSELQRMRDEAASLAKVKLQSLMLKSVLVLDESLDDPSPVLRQRTARDSGNPLPEAIDLAQRVVKSGVPVLTFAPLNSYLAQCKLDERVPDPDRITQTIVHGLLEMRGKRKCACGYHA